MPQKHPPASTAVSSPALCAGASAAGGGIGTAESACAASAAKARGLASRRTERFMGMFPETVLFSVYERIWLKASHKFTRLRERGGIIQSDACKHLLLAGGCRTSAYCSDDFWPLAVPSHVFGVIRELLCTSHCIAIQLS